MADLSVREGTEAASRREQAQSLAAFSPLPCRHYPLDGKQSLFSRFITFFLKKVCAYAINYIYLHAKNNVKSIKKQKRTKEKSVNKFIINH
jgi:hypothetical protein